MKYLMILLIACSCAVTRPGPHNKVRAKHYEPEKKHLTKGGIVVLTVIGMVAIVYWDGGFENPRKKP